MKEIKLLSLELVNFKGISSLHLDFTDNTCVCGANGTGKTTVFDAFCWLLFGKDSHNRADSAFNIKTLDKDGNVIYNLEHSVIGVLSVDGRSLRLQRTYREVWVKPRGTTEKTLKNHETIFYINDVKCATKKEYDAEISGIIPEGVFKMITNPRCFPTLPAEKQKEMLMRMAGDVTDDEVAATKPEFAKLLAEMAGVPMERYLKEVAAKKKACKDVLAIIPSQIETAQNLKPASEDWADLDKQIQKKRKSVSELDEKLKDRTKVTQDSFEAENALVVKLNQKKADLTDRTNKIRIEADSAHNKAVKEADDAYNAKINEYDKQITTIKNQMGQREGTLTATAGSAVTTADQEIEGVRKQINAKNQEIKALQSASNSQNTTQINLAGIIKKYTANIKVMEDSVQAKRNEYTEKAKEQLAFDPNDFICPTCKRPLDDDDCEAKRKELQKNFEDEKTKKLKEIQTAGKQMASQLAQLKQELDSYNTQLKQLNDSIAETQKELQDAQGDLLSLQQTLQEKIESRPAEPDYAKVLASDKAYHDLSVLLATAVDNKSKVEKVTIPDPIYSEIEAADQTCIDLKNSITELQNKIDNFKDADPVDTSDIEEQKKAINGEIEDLVKRMAKRDTIKKADDEIKKLEQKQDKNNQELAELEGIEYNALQFQKKKDSLLMERINGMFEIVSFSFVSNQLNGGEKLTCVCTVNGTPYPDVNHAGKINAGLDIINAICKSEGVCAPIFVDNAESINDVLPTVSQKVMLCVTRDSSLIIK